jgi:CubicO group peptidase (beta-lactamase class C family)
LLILLLSDVVDRADLYRSYGPESIARKVGIYGLFEDEPNVEWHLANPESYGISTARLDALTEELEESRTRAFIVVKDGNVVYEWYSRGYGANDTHSTAAMAKAVTGSMTLMAALDEGYIKFDDPAWEDDPLKSRITLADLASHTSGLDDVQFREDVTPEWKCTYYLNRDLRFSMALSDTPVIVEPGTRYSYSGIGYYALAYAITASIQSSAEPDIHQLLNNRIMEPLGIPQEAWRISYGESYEVDGLTLYAAGSGAKYTPRAAARIGQLILNDGRWNGQQVVSPEAIKAIVSYRPATADTTIGDTALLSVNGWISNANGHYSSLPRDAIFGTGDGHQLLLVVPSLDLVVVRMGGSLTDEVTANYSYWDQLDRYIFSPLMQALE